MFASLSASLKTTMVKFALGTAAAAGILGGAAAFGSNAQADVLYTPFYYDTSNMTGIFTTSDTNLFDNPYINESRFYAERVVNRLEFLSDADKAYYTSAIGIATSHSQINTYLYEAISENSFNAKYDK
ncbi:MAG: hypothetical protein Q3962_08805 [Corynebacterium sp.]|nr:hypothetical protein [Corynebacterium sp.]